MDYANKKKYFKEKFFIMLIFLFIVIVISATLGVANVSFLDSIRIILDKIPLIEKLINTNDIKEVYQKIILMIRLPRILLAGLVGAGLSTVGCSYQGIFKNPMADPYVLGVSTGAALGATIAIIFGFTISFFGLGIITFSAFSGAIVTIIVVYNIARVGNKVPVVNMLLSGIAVNFFLGSIISLLMVFHRDNVEKIIFWTMGSFSAADWERVIVITPIIIIGIIMVYIYARDLNIMLTGESSAQSLGINVETVKKQLLLITSIMVASAVSVSGVIGFVGLLVPHAFRLMIGPEHKVLIPYSAVGGAIFLIICDTLARNLIPPTEIPVGAITSLFGAPFFIYLLWKNNKK
ncbi:iron ABC transporter permease [Clostridium sediminicola]|uniref:FecCD family ABC transporter permease n=1 Tax=Clostridium sediminicola TaxID=3114879 RepID=UPI0031F23BBE